MKPWKPQNFEPEFPSPEDGWAFVLGGSMHGEIVHVPLVSPGRMCPYFRQMAPRILKDFTGDYHSEDHLSAYIETYRLEEFRVGANQRTVWFYIHEGDQTGDLLIRALTEFCMFKREERPLKSI